MEPYDPADFAAAERLSRNYERRAIQAIRKQPSVDRLRAKTEVEEDTILNDLARNFGISARNYAAITAGIVPDLVQIGGSTLAHLLVARDPDIPFTSDKLADTFGGDPNHPSFFVNSFAPTPAGAVGVVKTTKAGMMAAIGIKNMGYEKLAARAEELIKKGGNELTIFNKTGLFRDTDGTMRMFKSDKDLTINMRGLDDDKLQLWKSDVEASPGQKMVLTAMFPDIIDDPDLFKAYPQLKEYKYGFAIYLDDAGTVRIGDKKGRGIRGEFDSKNKKITTYLSDPNEVKSNFAHEIQHAMDEIEGYSYGDNPEVYYKIVDEWYDNVVERSIFKAFKDGAIDYERLVDGAPLSPEEQQTIYKLMEDNMIPQTTEAYEGLRREVRGLASLAEEFYFDIDGLLAASVANGAKARAKIKGFTVPLVESGVMTAEEAVGIMSLGPQGLRSLAFEKYFTNPGEVRARLADKLKDRSASELKKIPKTEGAVAVAPTASSMDTASDARKKIITLKDDYIHGDFGIRARGASKEQTYSSRSDDIYLSQRKRTWRQDDPDLTDEEVNAAALDDLKRFQKNKETVGSWDHGLHTVDLPTSAGGAGGPIKLDILKNPTKEEFTRWSRGKFRDFYRRPDVDESDVAGVRVITDVNGNVYVWDADDALHHDVIKGTGMQYNHEDDWTDVDSIPVNDLFNQLVQDGIYEKAYE